MANMGKGINEKWVLYILCFFSVLPIVRIFISLSRNGSSNKFKILILKRHFIYAILYALFVWDCFKNQITLDSDFKFNQLFQSVGFLMAISRIIFDPYVLNSLMSDLGIKPRVTKNEESKALCSFGNTAMNVEYVYLILISVEQFYSKNNKSNLMEI